MSYNQIDNVFQNVLDTFVKANAEALISKGWLFEQDPNFKALDDTNIVKLFNRDNLNKTTIDVINDTKKGYVRDYLVNRGQLDYLATMERDFRWRHRSRINIICNELARRTIHGNKASPFYTNVLKKIITDSQREQTNNDQ